MSIPCTYIHCSGNGIFQGEKCPGEDKEHHHCIDCGDLTHEDYGTQCPDCHTWWCRSAYDNLFIYGNDCTYSDLGDEAVCPHCFIKTPGYWCRKKKCACDAKIEPLKAKLKEHQKLGNLCGCVEMIKGEIILRYHLYRFVGKAKFRVKTARRDVGQQFVFTTAIFKDEQADDWTIDVIREIKAALADGFQLQKGEYGYGGVSGWFERYFKPV